MGAWGEDPSTEEWDGFVSRLNTVGGAGVPWDAPPRRGGRPKKDSPSAVSREREELYASGAGGGNAWKFIFETDAEARELDAEYSEFRLFTRSTNKHDHSTKVQVNVTPEFAAMITEAVNKGLVPGYRTPADVFRDGAFHRIRFWATNNGDPEFRRRAEVLIQTEMLRCEIEQMRQEREGIEANIRDAGVELDNFARLRDVNGLARFGATLAKMNIPDAYRERWDREVMDRLNELRVRLNAQ